MKTIFLNVIIAILFLSFPCSAEKDTNKIIFSANYGIGIPLNLQHASSYTSNFRLPIQYTYITTIYGSTAILGTSLDGSLAIPINRNGWSINGLVSYYENGFENMPVGSISINYLSGNPVFNLQGTPYKEYNFMVGLMKTFIKNKYSFDIWGDIGYGKLYSPEITFNDGYSYYDILAENGGGFALDIGTAFRYKILKKLFISLHVDLYYAGITYQTNYTVNPPPITYSGGNPLVTYDPPGNIAERMYIFNISGGLAYQL